MPAAITLSVTNHQQQGQQPGLGAAGGLGPEADLAVRADLQDGPGGLGDGLQGLQVRMTVASRPATGAALAVPSSAVSARPDGTSVVTVRSTGGRLTVVPVTTGATGDGYVEIASRDGGVRVGDEVVVGQ